MITDVAAQAFTGQPVHCVSPECVVPQGGSHGAPAVAGGRHLRLEHRQLERPGVGGRVRDGVVGPA